MNIIRKNWLYILKIFRLSEFLAAEVIIIPILLGFFTKSWLVFGCSLIGILIVISVRVLAKVWAIAMSVIWGFVIYYGGQYFGAGIILTYSLATLGFFLGILIHLEEIKDIHNNKKDKNNNLR